MAGRPSPASSSSSLSRHRRASLLPAAAALLASAALLLFSFSSSRLFLATSSPSSAVALRRQPPAAAVALRAGGAQVDEETEVWREAYDLEVERSELIAVQLKAEIERVGDVSAELREEFESCIVDLDPAPGKPESEAADEWAQAYTAIRRCNEQSELRLTEIRTKMQERGAAQAAARNPEVTMDFGPIMYKGITFKDITFKRFGSEAGGSQIFFLELLMPLGVGLEEKFIELRGGGVGRAVEVTQVVDGGSAFADGRIKTGDFLRAITVPQRRLTRSSEDEEEVGNFAESVGISAGNVEKALLVIPTESSFPFERILEDMKKNREIDGYVGMVLERSLD